MISRLHERLGTAGFVIAVVALIVALSGSAIAASGALTSKQKKEVQKIAQTEAKKYAKAGPQGPAGPQGQAGGKGDAGAKGDNGAPGADGQAGAAGSPGSAGQSVTSEEFGIAGKDGKCVTTGGTKFTSASGATYSCNGKAGSPWTAGGTLPSGSTETGTFGSAIAAGGFSFVPVTLSIPTEAPLEGIYVTGGKEFNESGTEVTAGKCPGVTDGVPAAEPGTLCVYPGIVSRDAGLPGPLQPDRRLPTPGTAPSGTEIGLQNTGSGEGAVGGVFAATAE